MKALKIYQCSYCSYIGGKENVQKHESQYCVSKRFDDFLKKTKNCDTCRHFYFEGGKHREKAFVCGKDNSRVQEVPLSNACPNYELDERWAEEERVKLQLSTSYKKKIVREPRHISERD